jgi:DNA invertase Pin-like site-specific DNA recombinase
MGYSYPAHLEFKEAISGHEVAYYQRPRLMDMLKAAERQEFQVLVITEVRALSRRGAGEVFVIYDTLQKANIALETLNEKFSDDLDPFLWRKRTWTLSSLVAHR